MITPGTPKRVVPQSPGKHMYGDAEEPVRVAAGVLKHDGQILICQRGINRRYGMKWEFPGGKTFPGETLGECLEREIWEELDIEPKKYVEIKTLEHQYSDGGHFVVTFFLITDYEGTIRNKVFEDMRWVPLADLASYDLLDGTRPIIQFL